MSVNFSAFEIGRRALNASQFGINIAGQNIANVNTPGYSRRYVQLAEGTTTSVGGVILGTGVTIQGVRSFRDILVQSRIQTETGIAGRLSAFREALNPVEIALNGADGGGLQNDLANFFGSFRDLDANPTSTSLRSVAVQRGINLANSFQATRAKLDDVRIDTDGQIRSAIDRVNSLSEQIAHINGEILGVDAAGADSSSLQDQRTNLITELAGLTGARQTLNSDGTVNLTIGEGRSIVSGNRAFTLNAVSGPPFGFAQIEIGGEPVTFDEGRIRGFQDAITETNKNIDTLDGLAAALVDRVNTLTTSGTDLDGNPGVNFFSPGSPVTAANISVNPAVVASSRLVVASPLSQPGQSGTIAGSIANLMTDTTTTVGTETGSFASIYGSMMSDMGERLSSASNDLETQAAIIAQATLQRDSVSGVSLDEEAINLLQYQKAFEAAARFIRVADEMTQTILSLAQ